MSAGFDMSRVVRSWLREDEHDSADHVLEIVLSRLDATPQRRPVWPPRRFPSMSTTARIAGAAAALVVAVAVGIRMLPGNGPGGPLVSNAPTSIPTPTPTPAPTVPAPNRTVQLTDAAFGRTVSVTLPANWGPGKQLRGQFEFGPPDSSVYLGFFVALRVYIDPCHPELGTRPAEGLGHLDDTELVQGLTSLTGVSATSPTTTEIGARTSPTFRSVTHFVLSNSIDTDTAGCTNGGLLPLFETVGAGVPDDTVSAGGGATEQVWVFGDVDHRNLLVVGEAADAEALQLLEAIVASIRA